MAGRDLSAELFSTPASSSEGRDLSADLFGEAPAPKGRVAEMKAFEPSFFEEIKNVGRRGLLQAEETKYALAFQSGLIDAATYAERMRVLNRKRGAAAPSGDVAAGLDRLQKANETESYTEVAKEIIKPKNWKALASLIAESAVGTAETVPITATGIVVGGPGGGAAAAGATSFASEFGAIEADANTINQVVTVVIGVNSVNNPAPATVGVEEETTEQARIRRRKSVQLPALTPLGAIISRVANAASVTDVIGYENDTDVYDAVTDIDPHTFWIIVEGGSIEDIAEAMATSKTGGAGTKGAVAGTYQEEIPRPSGGTFSITHTMNFDRPDPVSIHVRLTVKRKDPAQPVPIGTIADNLIARDYVIGQRVVASELYDTVYAAGNTFIAYDLEVSLNGSTWLDTDIDPGLDGKPFIDPDNISMIEVL